MTPRPELAPWPDDDLEPALTEAVVRWLLHLFGDASPQLKDSDREVWVRVGSKRVADFVRDTYERQQQD